MRSATRAPRPAVAAPRTASARKWLPVATITNRIRQRVHAPRRCAPPGSLAQPRQRHADHQRERDVHRRHRGVRVEERVDRDAVVVDAGEVRDGVEEAPLGEEARRRGREHGVADERDAERDHEHVAHEVEAVVVEEVEEDQRAERDRGLGVDVHPRGEVDDRRLVVGPGLHAGLDEDAQRLLDVDEVAGVLEGDGGALRVVDPAAREAVGVVGGQQQRQLPEQVQAAREGGNGPVVSAAAAASSQRS